MSLPGKVATASRSREISQINDYDGVFKEDLSVEIQPLYSSKTSDRIGGSAAESIRSRPAGPVPLDLDLGLDLIEKRYPHVREYRFFLSSAPLEEVPGIYFILHVVQHVIVAVRYDGTAFFFEGVHIIHHPAAEEGASIFQGGLIDDDVRPFGFDPLHDALDGALAEVVGVGLHGEPVYADGHRLFFGFVVFAAGVVVAGGCQDPVGDEIFPGAVGLHDGFDEVLRHILIVCQELLRILWEAVATVAEGGVIVEFPDPGVQAHAVNDFPGVEALHFRIGIKFIEVGHPHGEVSIGEELHRFRLGESHEPGGDIVLDGPFLEKPCKGMGRLHQPGIFGIRAHDDTAGIEVIVECLRFPQEFRTEEDILRPCLLPDFFGVPHGDGGLDHHDGMGIHLHHQVDHRLHGGGVEEIPLGIVIGRGGDDDDFRIFIGRFPVGGGGEVQILLRQVLLDVLILDRRLPVVHHVHLFRNDIHRHHMVVLGKKGGQRKAHIPRTCYCYIHNRSSLYHIILNVYHLFYTILLKSQNRITYQAKHLL